MYSAYSMSTYCNQHKSVGSSNREPRPEPPEMEMRMIAQTSREDATDHPPIEESLSNCEARSAWHEPRGKKSEEPRKEIQHPRQEIKCLERTLEQSSNDIGIDSSAVKMLEQAKAEIKRMKIVHLGDFEKLRRQKEICDTVCRQLTDTRQENIKLVQRLTKLQSWTDRLHDDQTKQTMRQLYHDLEMWVKNHFHCTAFEDEVPTAKSGEELDSLADNLDVFYDVYAFVSRDIFDFFLSRLVVGASNHTLQETIHQIYEQVRRKCPSHVSQYWYSATSTAVTSLAGTSLELELDIFINNVEAKYGDLSSTDPQTRQDQLKTLLRKFVEFKEKLERQPDMYYFRWADPNATFDNEKMTSFNGVCASDETVQYTLCPAIYKDSAEGQWTLVEKAVIKVFIPVLALCPEPAPESLPEFLAELSMTQEKFNTDPSMIEPQRSYPDLHASSALMAEPEQTRRGEPELKKKAQCKSGYGHDGR